MSKERVLLNKDFSWEELADLERDVYECIEYAEPKIPGEYSGTIKVLVTYEESNDDE
jgi:hypothetical protein